MSTKILKLLLAAAVITALAAGSGNDAEARTHRTPPQPHIIQQQQRGTARYIYFHNPLSKSIYVYIECEQHLTTIPFDVAPEHVAELVLPDIDASEQCLLNHYRIHVPGQSPEPWDPAGAYQGAGQ